MEITTQQASIFTDLLYDALVVSSPDSWTDYATVVQTFCQVASTGRLELFLSDGCGEMQLELVQAELDRRRRHAMADAQLANGEPGDVDELFHCLAPTNWDEQAAVDTDTYFHAMTTRQDTGD